uniref:glycosyltransferase n=1 Tax=Ndongobacter massiliensis TaxID=1871025 RepID=UPI000AD22B7B|nr:glycosyltransferase [Ndongobacter massiliensis]
MGIGLYLRRKGIVDFVELAKRMPQYKFIWFGYSNPITSTLDVQQAVKTELSNLNFAGYVENKDIILALQACDLYVFPTYEETEGIPAIEACAAGADFIVRDIPVFDTWLENGLNCYKAINVDDFEKKINDFLKRRLPSLKDKAYKVAEERDLARIGQKLKSAYKHAMRLRDLRVKYDS